jgi:membrane protease subunit HflC
MKYAVVTVVIVLLVSIFGTQTMFTQDEIQLSVVTRFGEIRQVYTQPGLKFKVPFIDQKTYFDKRLLYRDVPEATLPDLDTQFLNIDAYARYRIGHRENGVVVTSPADVKNFFETLTTLERAGERVERVVASTLRDEVSTRRREEIIGATVKTVVEQFIDPEKHISLEDALVLDNEAALGDEVTVGATVKTVVEEVSDPQRDISLEDALPLDNEAELDDEVTVPSVTRQQILDNVRVSAEQQIAEANLGLTLVDVRIKRADFPEETQQAIFTRMRAERERLAREFRAEGQRERDRIEADVDRQVAIIVAEANRDANITRGDGEAQSIGILADALGKDPEFYSFRRSLEAYTKFLTQNSTVVLSSESDLFSFLESTALSDDR